MQAARSVANLLRADFKSYKGHHTLLFGDAYFTSIIGPNGSGKSNSYAIPNPGIFCEAPTLTAPGWMPSRSF